MTGSTAASEPGAPASGSATARVLVVDDEAAIADLVSTTLRYEGFETSTAGDGRAALEAVEAFRPDLIVLDVMLPDLDGFEVQRKLIDRGLRVPVLFLTARDATEDKVRGLTCRRRRLRDEAVQPRGARCADPRDLAPHPRNRGAAAPHARRPRDGRRRRTRCSAPAR